MAEIRLIASDLDGTIIGKPEDFHLYSDFRDELEELRRRYGTIWVACTGRGRRGFDRFVNPMAGLGLRPDYAIIDHAYITHFYSNNLFIIIINTLRRTISTTLHFTGTIFFKYLFIRKTIT